MKRIGTTAQTLRSRITKRLLSMIWSDVGLAFLIIFYIFIGAVLFQYLENDTSIQKCEEGKNKDKATIKKYAQLFYNYISLNMTDSDRVTFLNESNLTAIVDNDTFQKWLVELRDSAVNISQVYKFAGQPCHVNSWIFESAILYTITLITTIGYGHITPSTWDGQVVSMCFSLIGIPLFLLWISRLSLKFGEFFRAFYSRVLLTLKYIFCPKKFCCKKRKLRHTAIKSDPSSKIVSIDVSSNDAEQSSFNSESVSVFSNESIEDLFLNTESRFKVLRKPIKKVSIPLYIVTLMIGIYVYVGSLVLNYLEGWDFTQAVYFSFVSMSTIGFGDFVPGIKNYKRKGDSLTDGMRILYGITYLIFGIAVMAMCYDLIQEDLFIRWTKFKVFFLDLTDLEDENDDSSNVKATISNYLKLAQEKKENTTLKLSNSKNDLN